MEDRQNIFAETSVVEELPICRLDDHSEDFLGNFTVRAMIEVNAPASK